MKVRFNRAPWWGLSHCSSAMRGGLYRFGHSNGLQEAPCCNEDLSRSIREIEGHLRNKYTRMKNENVIQSRRRRRPPNAADAIVNSAKTPGAGTGVPLMRNTPRSESV